MKYYILFDYTKEWGIYQLSKPIRDKKEAESLLDFYYMQDYICASDDIQYDRQSETKWFKDDGDDYQVIFANIEFKDKPKQYVVLEAKFSENEKYIRQYQNAQSNNGEELMRKYPKIEKEGYIRQVTYLEGVCTI